MDFGFGKVYTPAIIKFAWFMAVPGVLLAWVALTIGGFMINTWLGLLALFIVGPGIVVGGLLTLRVVYELVMLAVRAADDLHALRMASTTSVAPGSGLGSRPGPGPGPRDTGVS